VDGEGNSNSLNDVFLAGLSNGGHLRIFRNEIYCQTIKQASHNPSKYGRLHFFQPETVFYHESQHTPRESTVRAWELLALFCGFLYPTDEFLKYLAAHIMKVIRSLALFLLTCTDIPHVPIFSISTKRVISANMLGWHMANSR